MKTLKKLAAAAAVFTLFLSAGLAHATPAYYEIDEDYLIRVTVTEDVADQLSVTRTKNGEEITTPVAHGEIVSVSLLDENFDQALLPFTANQEGDDFIIQLGDPDPGHTEDPLVGFHSTLDIFSVDKESQLKIHAPSGSMVVAFSPGNIQDELAEPDPLFPMVIGESFKNFEMDGILDIQFIVKPGVDEESEGGDGGDQGEAGAGDEDGGLNQGFGDGGAGGCSMIIAKGTQSSMAGLSFLAFSGLLLVARRLC